MNADEHRIHRWTLPLFGGAAGIVAAPYVLPLAGVGVGAAGQVLNLCRNSGAMGSGLALGINKTLDMVPGVGHTLAVGGIASAVSAGVIGIGGSLLGDYLQRYDREGHIPWGKIIKYAAITTSILIALPSILGGISMGLTYLALLTGNAGFASAVAGAMNATLGFMGGVNGATGIVGLLPHLFTCGAAIMPVFGALLLGHKPAHAAQAANGMQVELLDTEPARIGQPCRLSFRLRDAFGRILGPDDLQTTHTQKLHTMVVDGSLRDYHHLHPQYDAASGTFNASFTPRLNQPYVAWNDFTPAGAANPVHLRAELPSTAHAMLPVWNMGQPGHGGGLRAAIRVEPPLASGQDSMVTVELRDDQGRIPADLEPVMGAYAHLGGFSGNGNEFIHCHPVGIEPTTETDRSQGHLMFHVEPQTDGPIRFFLQIRRQGQDIAIPFDQRARAAGQFAERNLHASHTHMAMA